MWKTINSPIVITIIVIASLFVMKSQMNRSMAAEVRGVYEEIIRIIEDGATDAEKTKALKKFAQEIAGQIREGFSAGFKSKEKAATDRDRIYIETKNKIAFLNIKKTASKWQGRERFIFIARNDSNQYLESLKLNYSFYRNGELIDTENKWISEYKMIEPQQEIVLSVERQLPKGLAKQEQAAHLSDQLKIQVTSFNIKEIK